MSDLRTGGQGQGSAPGTQLLRQGAEPDPALLYHRERFPLQPLQVQCDGDPLIITQGQTDGGYRTAVHGMDVQIPGTEIDGHPACHVPADPPFPAVVDLQYVGVRLMLQRDMLRDQPGLRELDPWKKLKLPQRSLTALLQQQAGRLKGALIHGVHPAYPWGRRSPPSSRSYGAVPGPGWCRPPGNRPPSPSSG